MSIWFKFDEIDRQVVLPDIQLVQQQQKEFKFFDINEKMPFDKPQHYRMRCHLQNEKLNPSKLVETTLQRISENRYLEIFGPKAEERKSKERKLSQISKKIKILSGNVPADVTRKKSLASLNRADWEDKYMLSRKRRELKTEPSESQLP